MVSFTARRREPELVAPARPTPHELKYLSDIDNQRSMRYYATIIEFFRGDQASDNVQLGRRDPVVAIRSALAESLVYFYAVAGRLRELPSDGRLVLDCTAEGVVFLEADADVSLAELGEPLLPPYPCVDELLCDLLGDSKEVVGKPLCFFQVTRFRCGGFAIGVHFCHAVFDGTGICKFMEAVGDLARGEAQPTVLPVWERDILTSRAPPLFPRKHLLAYEPLASNSAATNDVMLTTPPGDMVGRYFFFGPAEISAMRSHVPAILSQSSTVFDLLAAALWRGRTAALGYAPDQRVRLMFAARTRHEKRFPTVPKGYYGFALVLPVAETSAAELCGSGLAYAVQLLRRAKLEVDKEYVRSTVDLMARRKWPHVVMDMTYVVSDITSIGEDTFDFGWGKRISGGVPMAGDTMNILCSYFVKCKNANGEDCTAVPMYLPRVAMGRFAERISVWSNKNPGNKKATMSSL